MMRHSYIKKFVASSVFVTCCFGGASVLYLNHQSKFEGFLEEKQSIQAFSKSLKIDEKFLLNDLDKSDNSCDLIKPQGCRILAKSILSVNNRIQDYEIFLKKTLQISPDSKILLKLDGFRHDINQLAKTTFGISFQSAKKKGVVTVEDFLDLSQEIVNPAKSQTNARASKAVIIEIKKAALAKLESYLISYHENDANISSSYLELNKYFAILVALELLLFLIVNLIDIANNNVEPGKEDKLEINSLRPKVKPLLVSLSFSLIVIGASQYALKLEQKNSLATYCRSLNQQNINFMNTVLSYGENVKEIGFYRNFAIDNICNNFLTISARDDIIELKELSIRKLNVAHEAYVETSRIHADNIQEEQNKNSKLSRSILSLILIFNVLSLAAMSIFLRYDSADIGSGS